MVPDAPVRVEVDQELDPFKERVALGRLEPIDYIVYALSFRHESHPFDRIVDYELTVASSEARISRYGCVVRPVIVGGHLTVEDVFEALQSGLEVPVEEFHR